MVITVSIVGTATAIINEQDYITISQEVKIMDGVTVLGQKVISIRVFRYTSNVYTYALDRMVDAINEYTALCTKQRGINNLTANFTTDLIARV